MLKMGSKKTALLAAIVGLIVSLFARNNVAESGGVLTKFVEKPACLELNQQFQRLADKSNQRKLNFLLFDASARNCIALITQLLDNGASVSAQDRFGNTALGVASRSGHRGTVELLLKNRSDISHLNLAGSSALLRAVNANHRKTAELLLKNGADPNQTNIKQISPLIAATYHGNLSLVKLLLNAGAKPQQVDTSGKGPIIYAAGKGYTDILKLLVAKGTNPNHVYGNGLTALMWAAGHSNDVPLQEGVATVQFLIGKVKKLDQADNRGRTALMIAAERNHPAIVKILRAAGADISKTDNTGKTAFQLSASKDVRNELTN
jgi:ankyrin repeat protein